MQKDLRDSVKTSLFDKNYISDDLHQIKLVKKEKASSILSEFIYYMNISDEIYISVAFITQSGIASIKQTLIDLNSKDIPVYIVTGDYLLFTDPIALKILLSFDNIKIKFSQNNSLHAKGYIFKVKELYTIFVGSVNLTASALQKNEEWLLKATSLNDGKLVDSVLSEFKKIYNNADKIDNTLLEEYSTKYEDKKNSTKIIKESKNLKTYIPNSMQNNTINNIEKLIDDNQNKALLISATGTGKTLLSLFVAQLLKPKKMLFVIHSQTIATKSKNTYEEVIKDKSFGLINSTNKDIDKDFIFANVQTLAKDEILNSFNKDHFDYIVIDESHHAKASMYEKVINYFEPKFMLGMTATPERTDGQNIFEMFDYNIANEIRLLDALNSELLVPFHYYGVEDVLINEESLNFNDITIDQRVSHIIETSNKYGHYGDIKKGLIFINNIENGISLEKELLNRNIKCKFLSGSNTIIERENTISKLQNGELEFIITVDIFNEGIDIPEVNQVLLIRPTKSAIVYTQQIGRGLRKSDNKKYVVIIDFIGNYEKNYLIPIALSGDNSYKKSELRNFVNHGTDLVPGTSTISFTKIVKEKIINNIEQSSFSKLANIKESYLNLKFKLGRIPLYSDFYENNEISPEVIIEHKNCRTSIDMINKFEENKIIKSKDMLLTLKFLTMYYTSLKRPHENIILELLLTNDNISFSKIQEILENEYMLYDQHHIIKNAVDHLAKNIGNSHSVLNEYVPVITTSDNNITITKKFKEYLNDTDFIMSYKDIIKYNKLYINKLDMIFSYNSLILFNEYDKREAYKYGLIDYNNGMQVKGYSTEINGNVLLFLKMDESNYDNKITGNKIFSYYSQDNRTTFRNNKKTVEGKMADNEVDMHIFMSQGKDSEKNIYVGKVSKVIDYEVIKNSKNQDVVKYQFELENAIPGEVMNYLSK